MGCDQGGRDDESWVKREREEFLYPKGECKIKRRRARLSRITARDRAIENEAICLASPMG